MGAAREVPQDSLRLTPGERTLQMRGETIAGLGAGRNPRSQQPVHAPLMRRGRGAIHEVRTIAAMAGDDDALLARAREGDVEAFAEVVHRYEHRVRAVLLRLLDDERDAEEATQDVFIQAWRNLDRFRGDSAVFTWLYRIAVNEALARKRRRRLPTTVLDETPERIATPHDAVESDELQSFLAEQIRALEPEYRAPLVLRDVIGLTNQEVADVLGLSLAAAKSRIHRARMQIRRELVRWERESE
jgi:RNA polymerase sigma-70 factor, ECF subfamily